MIDSCRHSAFATFAASFLLPFVDARTAEAGTVPFAVRDSIAWTHVIPIAAPALSSRAALDVALHSAGGSGFILHTRRGDLARNVVVDSLLLFDRGAIGNGFSQPASSPRVLVELQISNDSGVISDIRWLSDNEIAFIAQGDNGQNQIFAVSSQDGQVSQLTRSETPVAAFSAAADSILFYAHSKLKADPPASAVGERSLPTVLFGNADPASTPLELFQLSRSSGRVQRIGLPAMRLHTVFRRIWISPGGEYAVVFTPSVNAPAHWEAYRTARYALTGYATERRHADPTSPELLLHTRYALVDLRTNTVRPLLDAPSGALSGNRTPFEVFWPHARRSVIVSNTYLPLNEAGEEDRERRRTYPAIAEIDLESGQVAIALWEAGPRDAEVRGQQEFRITSIEWDPGQNSLRVTKALRQKDGGRVADSELRKKVGHEWVSVPDVAARPTQSAAPKVRLQQALNERPRIFIQDPAGLDRLLYDPNPHADMFTFGRTKVFRWIEPKSRIEWRGGLLYPPNHIPNRAYPLVVQTHGFDPEAFLLDGPAGPDSGTAMAAQALANAGFIVLQVEDNAAASTRDEREGPLYADGIHAAVQSLVADQIVDRTRIGLVAFSRTGMHAVHLLARYPDLLAAVNVSDSMQTGYWNHLLNVNERATTVSEAAQLSGGLPDVARIGEWFSRQPTYGLPNVSAAVRLEAIAPWSVVGMWEVYATLRSANRSVDFIYFPEGSHNLMKPLERLVSQGGNVDWFRFWLKNELDKCGVDEDRCVRWRALRELQSDAH